MNSSELKEQLVFRNLLEKNGVEYEELIPRGKAAQEVVEYAKRLMNLAHVVDESVAAPSFGNKSM